MIMSDIEIVSQEVWNNQDSTRVPYGSIPLGDAEDYLQADSDSFESFAEGVVPAMSWDNQKGSTPKKRGPGRPKKTNVKDKG